jgi:hypothetical protein
MDESDYIIKPNIASYYTNLNSIDIYTPYHQDSGWASFLGSDNTLPTNTSSFHSWKHVALTIRGTAAWVCMNGTVRGMLAQTINKPIFRIFNCLAYKDNYTRKTTKFHVAQFAVWNYPRYTSDFTVQNKLIIDKNYVV